MLHQFLSDNRAELISRCRAKVVRRSAPRATELELEHGIPQFLEQLIRTLRVEEKIARRKGEGGAAQAEAISGPAEPMADSSSEIGQTAAKHGDELLRRGFTVDQVVHDYGDLCQSVTELALERDAPFTTDEFRTLNRCLDNGIADAVTEYSRQRDQSRSDEGVRASNERLGAFAHELRNSLNTATLAIGAIKSGRVAFGGATGGVFDRSMMALRALVDRSLAEVRLTAGVPVVRERMALGELLEEVQVAAAMEANARGLQLTVAPVDDELMVEADRQILASALSNLLHNALKFTKPNGQVWLRAQATAERILIEVEDECGGLPTDRVEELFHPFEQRNADRSGLGLGLAISRRAVEANDGRLLARSVEGKGCVFTVDLPKVPARR